MQRTRPILTLEHPRMSYDAIEASTAEGRPYFLYQFIEGSEAWR
ncbi:MAG: hypothetical protein ACI89J_004431, partial [Hyphomicrobiaceae bacterium]